MHKEKPSPNNKGQLFTTMFQELDYDGTGSSHNGRGRENFSRKERTEDIPHYVALTEVADTIKPSDVSQIKNNIKNHILMQTK